MADLLFSDIAGSSIKTGTDIIFTSGRSAIGTAAGAYVNDAQAASLTAAHPRFGAQTTNGRHFRLLPEAGPLPVDIAGATGDGATSDREAVSAAHAYALATGCGGVRFGPRTYSFDPTPLALVNYNQGPQPCYVVPTDARLVDGGGAQFNLTGGRGLVCGFWFAGAETDLEIAADLAAGATVVQLVAGAGTSLAVGDTVIWKLGDVPGDPVETFNWGMARVKAIAGDTITLDRPIPEGFAVASSAAQNRHLRKVVIARDLRFRDFVLQGSNGAGTGLTVYGAERIAFDRIGARGLASSAIVCRYTEGATLTDCWQEDATIGLAGSGAAFAFSESRNITLIRPRASGALTMVRCEAASEAQVTGAHFANTITDANGQSLGTQVIAFTANGRSRISAHDTTITGFGGYHLSGVTNGDPSQDGQICFTGRTRLIHPTSPFSLPLQSMSGMLDMTIAGQWELYNLDKLRVYKRRFNLRDGQFRNSMGPAGLMVRARCYVSPGVTVGTGNQLTALAIGREGTLGGNIANGIMGGIRPGNDVQLRVTAGAVAGVQWIDRLKPLLITCATATGAGLDTANEFVELEIWMAEPEFADRPVSEADWRNEGNEREVLEARFGGYDLPPIGAGARLSVDLPIPEMLAGDFIESVRLASGLSGLAIHSAEALGGLARIVIRNDTAATIDKAPTDIGVEYSRSTLGA